MAFSIKRFLTDQRGTTFEGIALSVSIIAVGFVASADMLDYLTKNRAAPVMVARKATPATIASNNLDETPTGTLPKLISRSVLDPCTGVIR